MNSRELDFAVATKVMRWKLVRYEDGSRVPPSKWKHAANNDGYTWEGRAGGREAHEWSPSSSISDAMEVIETVRTRDGPIQIAFCSNLLLMSNMRNVRMDVETTLWVLFFMQGGPTPENICLAALSALSPATESEVKP